MRMVQCSERLLALCFRRELAKEVDSESEGPEGLDSETLKSISAAGLVSSFRLLSPCNRE